MDKKTRVGSRTVSTVFLGGAYADSDYPYETVVRDDNGESLHGFTQVYSSRAEAESGHGEVVARLHAEKR